MTAANGTRFCFYCFVLVLVFCCFFFFFFFGFFSEQCSSFLHYVCFTVMSHWFVCIEVLRPSQPNGVMSSEVSLPSHTFTGQA